ncbi:hypothetical protein BDQ17DRAFT_1323705 [Cyathus striatus]|nr:hypothetical protein BDQ17DRAFT_1323705 [Cyathus striatus]
MIIPTSKKCSYIHLAVGMQERGNLTQIDCKACLTVLTPVDSSDYQAVIIPEQGKPHSHPTFHPHKVPFAVKEEYHKCIKAVGSLSATTSKVDAGVIHECGKEKSLTPSERYIHCVHEFGDNAHVVITLNTYLAKFLLEAVWMMVDTTFKIVHGDTNEFKVVIWIGALNRSLVVGHVWTNSATQEAFFNVWNGLFSAIKVVMGKELNFKIFSSGSSLLGVIGDAEGTQAQGFGDMVLAWCLNNSNKTGLVLPDSNSILMYLWKTCLVHFNHGILNLRPHVSEDMANFLRSFPLLDSDDKIKHYQDFCLKLGQHNKKVKGSHANDNRFISTKHTLLQAILLAKGIDNDTAHVLKASIESGMLTNSYNSSQH